MVVRPQDLILAYKAKRAGANYSLRIVLEARRSGIPVSLGFALVEQESAFRNVFGHDAGSILKGQTVTLDRVRRLLAHIRAGGVSNGVGPTQLTYPPFIREAHNLGGAHRPKNTIRVGFKVLASLIRSHGRRGGVRRYNGSGPAAEAYADSVLHKMKRWHRILA